MFCQKCGAENNDGTVYCTSCGSPMVIVTVYSNPQSTSTGYNEVFWLLFIGIVLAALWVTGLFWRIYYLILHTLGIPSNIFL